MYPLETLAFIVAGLGTLLWLYRHPSKKQRERALRTQDLRKGDWRA